MTATSSTTSSSNPVDLEADFDKFATLFSPATPRASPTQQAIPLPDIESRSAPTQPHHSRGGPSTGSADDFGAFVSVPAVEDPLAAFDTLDSPLAEPHTLDSVAGSSKRRSAGLDFFDKFSRDAKAASERNKKGVLDELLQHEDDPLYWLKDAKEDPRAVLISNDAEKRQDDEFGEMVQAGSPRSSRDEPLVDLGFDDFASLRQVDSRSSDTSRDKPNSHSSSPTRRSNRWSRTAHPPLHRKRSSSLHPPTLASPIASTSSATSAPYPAGGHPENYLPSVFPPRPVPVRSSSYQTLSSLSSKWMSSFKSSNRQSPPTNTLESLFAPFASVAPSQSTSSPHQSSASQIPTLHHASTLPFASSSIPPVQISHGTPFAPPPPNSTTSPFGPHIYIPPTGAPGYAGECYDWDKGFSEELQHELSLASEMNSEVAAKVNGKSEDANGTVTSVGGLMEKKSGSIELIGRWGSTDEVLSTGLADLIRPHLPALSRLSRKWNLVYSLDQHGISLNTLYDRCERLGQTKTSTGTTNRGALIAIKDSGNVVFGAWMGEGIRMTKGRGYYGSGESFLWRFANHKLDVYKWTGKNGYVTLCESGFISFGGGDGHYGLYLDDTLFDGSSAKCPTFDNDPLCSPGPEKAGAVSFECVGLEVWSVAS
ncbi:TLD-domain-containing protein [Pleurotus eryngii]|uniref:Oxidation resistance protein 1 n=1 Tax=Pleurotus eryngii TaxID=5323 RepID=A0A9P5ZTD3_PLEER|nr:TLD-domain-containing protein [Pleurotus eryngii]